MDRETITAAYSAAKARLIAENRYDPDVFQDTWLECLTQEGTDFPGRYRRLLADSYFTTAVFVHPDETIFLLLESPTEDDETSGYPENMTEILKLARKILNRRQYGIFVLKYKKGMKHSDIGDYYGMSENAVTQSVGKAIRNIQKYYNPKKSRI